MLPRLLKLSSLDTMATDIEMDNLREKKVDRNEVPPSEEQTPVHDSRDGSVTVWAWGSAAMYVHRNVSSIAAMLIALP